MGQDSKALIACHDCDTLHRRVPLRRGQEARCGRCGARLYRHDALAAGEALALAVAALIVYVLANTQPVMTIDLQGQRQAATLLDAVRVLIAEGLLPAALVVLATVIVLPLAELLLLLGVLLPLGLGRQPPWLHHLLRWLLRVRPWVMMDVLLMAIVVSAVKLLHSAIVIPGIALWAFAALAFLMAALATLDPHALWARLDAPGDGSGA